LTGQRRVLTALDRLLDLQGVLVAAEEPEGPLPIKEHRRSGSLGRAVAEGLTDSGVRPKHCLSLAIPEESSHNVGKQPYLWAGCGLSRETIAAATRTSVAALRG